jgi:glyoxylase-like metal-dependent hydrolase (beta-lactamase superfamily II)
VKLTEDVALVGSGAFGFDLTSPADCHVYLLDGGDELALVDAGVGGPVGDTDAIIATVRADGHDPDRIGRLLLTHYHADHAGGAADVHERLGCAVHASPLTARTLEAGDEVQSGVRAAKAAGLFPDEFRLRPCPATGDLVEGASFSVGRLTITPFDTPGHAAGHVSFLVEGGERRYLLQGDVVFFGGTILLQEIPDCSIQDYAATVRKLAQLEFDAFLPGHLGVSLRNGRRHIDAAADVFNKLLVPRNVV